MMKKLITILSFLMLASLSAFCQFPSTQWFGNPTTLTEFRGAEKADSGFVLGGFSDTTIINLNPYIKTYAGMHVRVINAEYMRNSTANAWLGPFTLGAFNALSLDATTLRSQLGGAMTKSDTINGKRLYTMLWDSLQNMDIRISDAGGVFKIRQINSLTSGVTFDQSQNGGMFLIDVQNNNEVPFRTVANDWGFVRNELENTITPTQAAAQGQNYAGTATGWLAKNTFGGQAALIYVGVKNSPVADSAMGLQATGVAGMKLDANNLGYIRFTGSIFESGTEYARFAATTGFLGLNTKTPTHQLTINGQERITNINNASIFDSALFINNGVIEAGLVTNMSVPINNILAATARNTQNHANFNQTWNWNSLDTIGLLLQSVSTTASSANQKVLSVLSSGANAASSSSSWAILAQNSHTGTGSVNYGVYGAALNGETNYALFANASGGSTDNLALYTQAGRVQINVGTTTQTTTSSGIYTPMNSLTSGTGHYISSITQTSGTLLFLQMTGTAGTGKSGINITSTGANSNNNIVTYGFISNIANSGTGSSNVGYYSNVNSSESSYGFYADGGSGVASLGVADQKIGYFANVTGGTVNTGAYLLGAQHAIIIPSNGGNVGIGTIAPTSTNKVEVVADAAGIGVKSTSTSGVGLYGVSSSATGTYGETSTLFGVYGAETGNGGVAVYANGSTTSGTGTGVLAQVTGAATNNIAGQFEASGATNNRAIIVPPSKGIVGLGTTTPTAGILHIVVPTTTATTTASGIYEDLTTVTSGTGHYIAASGLTSGVEFHVVGTSTALAAGNAAIKVAVSGVNGTNAITATGISSTVTNTNGTSGTNVGIFGSASGATTKNISIWANERIEIGAPTTNNNQALNIQSLTNTGSDGIAVYFANLTAKMNYGAQTIQSSGGMIINALATGIEMVGPSAAGVSISTSNITPTSTLTVDGSFGAKIASSAIDVTINATTYTMLLTATGKTATLPTAVGITGRIYTVKLTAAGTGTVATTGGQTIDGGATYALTAQNKVAQFQSDGANWWVISNN